MPRKKEDLAEGVTGQRVETTKSPIALHPTVVMCVEVHSFTQTNPSPSFPPYRPPPTLGIDQVFKEGSPKNHSD